jgi:hypothetical protein
MVIEPASRRSHSAVGAEGAAGRGEPLGKRQLAPSRYWRWEERLQALRR